MRFVFVALTVAFLSLPSFARADAKPMASSIVAVVGEQGITRYDLESQLRWMMVTTHIPDTPDNVAKLKPQALRVLIDQRLQLQDAARLGLVIGEEDITQALGELEKQRHLPEGALVEMAQKSGVPESIVRESMRAQIAWGKIIARKVRAQVKVSDEEVAQAARKQPGLGMPQEVELAVLTLPVDKPSREAEVRRAADRLEAAVRQGADFTEVARQFAGGGVRGATLSSFWVRPEEMNPSLAAALRDAKPGMVSAPIRTENGFTLIKVYNVRTADGEAQSDREVTLKQILLSLKADAAKQEVDALLHIGEAVAKNPGECTEKGIARIADLQDFDIHVDFITQKLSELSPAVRSIVAPLSIGKISSPFASEEGIRLYMVCGQKDIPLPDALRERIYNAIFQQKLELEAQKAMRNLRREAFVEVRG